MTRASELERKRDLYYGVEFDGGKLLKETQFLQQVMSKFGKLSIHMFILKIKMSD